MVPSAHILGLFLTPDDLLHARISTDNRRQHLFIYRIKLLDSHDCSVRDLVLTAELDQIVVHLARAEDQSLDLLRLGNPLLIKHFAEMSLEEVLTGRNTLLVTEQAL